MLDTLQQLDDYVEFELPKTKRSKPAKRKWREIEALKDKKRLQQELKELGFDSSELDELNLY
ncbi:DUF3545 family protein [Vibrio sp.]|nr:DUF3545 family protein [Vibrio sp.]